MIYLGIREDDRSVYAGGNHYILDRIKPNPILLPLRFDECEGLNPSADIRNASGRLFWEDSFDPITRVRRGRVYMREDCGQPAYTNIETNIPVSENVKVRAYRYQTDSLHALIKAPSSKLPKVYLGGGEQPSIWKIIDIEYDAYETYTLVLKSYRSLGEIPEILWEVVPLEFHSQLEERIDHVDNSVNRAAPNDVVDRCRDGLSLILSHLVGAPHKDLGKALKDYTEHPEGRERKMVHNAVDLVRRLHSRGKPNEQHRLGTRSLSEEDAQLAVRCLGLVLKEIGWAV